MEVRLHKYRTHTCGELRSQHVGSVVRLSGWIHSRRDHGGVLFIDLRDHYGITQIVVRPEKEFQRTCAHLSKESVVRFDGTVAERSSETVNSKLPTGMIEVIASNFELLGSCAATPFPVFPEDPSPEDLRLTYRFLDLRRSRLHQNVVLRSRIISHLRRKMTELGFNEFQTPILTSSSPEGARDFLVPSRMHPGSFYALPQAPQQFKQLLMVAGFERYYQIVRCFRDEDLRADRQPEFTQVDLEMSFAGEETIIRIVEGMMSDLFQKVMGRSISLPMPRLNYKDAMERFGTDRPDTRFGLELKDITDVVKGSHFQVFKSVAEAGGCIKAICVEGPAASFSRKGLDELSRMVVSWGGKGLSSAKITEDGWQSSLDKFFSKEQKREINRRVGGSPGCILLIMADKPKVVNQVLGLLRLEMAKRLDLIRSDVFSFVWVVEFPLLEFNEAEGRLDAVHHPFTAPVEEDIPLLREHPERARAMAYDIVLNGSEVGGGSVRIHNTALQDEIFRLLGISREDADMKFGFLLEALKYGAPPHAGIALGFDRLVAILTGAESIREVIAFPKTQTASCLLTDAPSRVDPKQLDELGLCLKGDG